MVHLGAVHDVPGCSFVQNAGRTLGSVPGRDSPALLPHRGNSGVCDSQFVAHACFLYARRELRRLEVCAGCGAHECLGVSFALHFDRADFCLPECVAFWFRLCRGGLLLPWLGIASVMIVSVAVSKYAKGAGLKAVMAVSASNYIIYLFHTTFEGFAKALLQKLHIQVVNADITFVLGVVFVILCGIACPMLLHRLVLQKNKVCRVLFGLK